MKLDLKQKLDAFLDRLNTHGTAAAGVSIFIPALTLLTNQGYAEKLVHTYAPHVNDALTPLAAAILTGFAGWLLYQARPHNIPPGS